MFFADGFEEIEAITQVDIMRRAGFKVLISGLCSKTVRGAHGIVVIADIILSEIKEIPKAIILPGGMPGSINLKDDMKLRKLIQQVYNSGNLVAAICAAPIALNAADILINKNITSYPTVKTQFIGSNYTGRRVERDGNIITAKGVGASFEFALKIVEYLGKKNKAEELSQAMFINCD